MLFLNIHHSEPVEFETFADGNYRGSTYEEYLAGAWIELTKKHLTFRNKHPECSVREWIEMNMIPQPPEPTFGEKKEAALRAVDNVFSSRVNALLADIKMQVEVLKLIDPDSVDEFESIRDKAKIVIEKAEDEWAIEDSLNWFRELTGEFRMRAKEPAEDDEREIVKP